MNDRASYDRILVAAFVSAIASILTQTLAERFVPALPARTVGTVASICVLIYTLRPRPTGRRAALAVLGAVGVSYLLEKIV